MSKQTMSMEAALDEERRGVLELLEGMNKASKQQRPSTSSMAGDRSASPYTIPRSPVRSMLDVGDNPIPRHSSLGGTNGGIPAPNQLPIRSMLDIGRGPPVAKSSPKAVSAHTSPTESYYASSQHPRSISDTVSRPPDFGPRGAKGDITAGYQFSGILPSNPGGPVAPKRNTLAGKKALSNAMAEAVRGELGAYGSKDRGRSLGSGLGSSNKSRSPHNRLGMRSNSPGLLSANGSQSSSKYALDSGTVVDMNSAYRRLSDANLALAGGTFGELAQRGRKQRAGSDDQVKRLEKDYVLNEGDDAVADSSDEDNTTDDEGHRGRRKAARDNEGTEQMAQGPLGMGRAQGPRSARSLMAAAEEERQMIAAEQNKKYKVRSLLEPEITVTGPMGDRIKPTKTGVHPNNAFDQSPSGFNTPHDSEEEADIDDIRRAQKLAIHLTAINSTPQTKRTVRTIFRGDFAQMQKEAEDETRRVRKYLVATDLSEEAAHALEWTIGTVLRDGDTMLAIYCVDEETGILPATVDPSALATQAAVASEAGAQAPPLTPPTVPSHPQGSSPLANLSNISVNTASVSPDNRGQTKDEQERFRAVDDITERVSKLLRKTKLQVRVVIEVLHCKSPKHMICEVIDFIQPTLVILGSRGQSALKGVILGSFSNYLVTKSSVPTMVARKKLRKHTKYKRPDSAMTNNLDKVSGSALANAKVD